VIGTSGSSQITESKVSDQQTPLEAH